MPQRTEHRLQQADLLTRGVENVFRRLIRFLVGRISLVRLLEMIRHIYVEETEIKLRAEHPGKNVPMTRLALHTGLDTRALVQIRKRLQQGESRYRQQFLAELTPESAVVEAWAGRMASRGGGAELAFGGEDTGFESLVRATVPTRGITTQSILQRLEDTRSVEVDRKRRQVRLVVDHFSPYLSEDEPSILNAALSAIANLVSTVDHNLSAAPGDKLFQRQAWTFRLHPGDRAAFRAEMRTMLESFEKQARERIGPWERDQYGGDQVTAGTGLYYFEGT